MMVENMIVPIETTQFYTSSIVDYASASSSSTMEQNHSTTMAMNLTKAEFCTRLRENLTELQQSQMDWAAYECEHAPQLTDKVILKVIVLGLIGFFSLIGNIATIWNIQKNRATRRAMRHSCSAIYALILHLSVADILVTFFCIIGEALWSYTVEWLAGDVLCKLVKIFQMFALYLSTNVLVLIGIDRFVAVKYPMKSKFLNTARFVVSRHFFHRKKVVDGKKFPRFVSGFYIRTIFHLKCASGESKSSIYIFIYTSSLCHCDKRLSVVRQTPIECLVPRAACLSSGKITCTSKIDRKLSLSLLIILIRKDFKQQTQIFTHTVGRGMRKFQASKLRC
jgi:hypothetical protein